MTSRIALVALAVTLAAPTLSFAAWAPNGTPLCTATGAQLAPTSASDGSGGMIVVWLDARRGYSIDDIYATRVLGDGTIAPGWPVNGIALTQSGNAGPPRAVPDGAGGALVMWVDSDGLRAQRVTGGGAIGAGFPANGKLVVSAVGFEAITDDAGGAYLLCFQDHFDSLGNYKSMGAVVIRIGPDAAKPPNWVPDLGVEIGASVFQYSGVIAGIAPGPGGSCVYGVITMEDGPLANPRSAFSGRVQSNGTEQGQLLPNYLSPTGTNPGPRKIQIVADGAGGHFAFKMDSNESTFENQCHHLTNSWAENWPPATHAPFTTPYLVSDGGLGVFLFGATGSPTRLEADYFSSPGTPGWPLGSVVLSPPATFENVVVAPLLGGAFACWSENADTTQAGQFYDIRAAHVSSAGIVTEGTAPDRSPICNAAASQLSPTFVIDGFGALVAWEDQRGVNGTDIYANRIVLDPTTAVQVSLAAAEVTSEAVRLRWSVVDPNGAATVMRRTRAGDWTAIGAPVASAGSLSFEDHDIAPGTEYGYALTFSGDPVTRLGEHWVQVPAIAAALAGFVPNPSTGAPRIAFTLHSGEHARLEVIDLAGRKVMTRDVGSFGPGSHTIDLAGTPLAAGVYLMRLTEGDHVHTTRGIVVR